MKSFFVIAVALANVALAQVWSLTIFSSLTFAQKKNLRLVYCIKPPLLSHVSNIIFLLLFLDKRHRRAEMAFLLVAVVVSPNSATQGGGLP